MRVTIASGSDAGKVVLVGRGGRVRIGRSRECDIALPDAKASREHCELSVTDEGVVVLADLGSSNGTWVNGQRLDRAVSLRGDERLWIGDTVLDLAPDPAAQGAPAGGSRVAHAATQGSQVQRAASSVASAVLLRPPEHPPRTTLAATERMMSRALKVGAIVLFALLGGLTLLVIGIETGPVVFVTATLMALLPVPIYLSLALFVDRNEREPRWMVVTTFFWGACVAVFVALLLNTLGQLVVASAFGEETGEIYGFSISAPVVEETAKAVILFIIYRRFRGEFNGIVDGIVYATLVGLGFATTENILYYGRGALEMGVEGALGTFVVRGVFSPFAHPLFTAMTGIGLGIASRSTKTSTRVLAPLLGLLGAILLHSLWNTSASFGVVFFAVYLLVMAPLFGGMFFLIAGVLKRERRTIGEYLAYDVGRGALTPRELAVLVNASLRRGAVREAKRLGGKPARDLRRQLHQATTELAFLRERIARGIDPWDAETAELHARYEAEVADVRARLGPLLFLPALAFQPAAVAMPPPAPAPALAQSTAPTPVAALAGLPPLPPLPAPQPRDWWRGS